MKIALCDDKPSQLRILADAARKCSIWRGKEIGIDTFTSGAKLLESIKGGRQYEYIFLDIEMPEISGFDVFAEPNNSAKPQSFLFQRTLNYCRKRSRFDRMDFYQNLIIKELSTRPSKASMLK